MDGPFVDAFCASCDEWTRVRGGETLCGNCLRLVEKTRRELALDLLSNRAHLLELAKNDTDYAWDMETANLREIAEEGE